eukprot:scaffold210260_cov46-Prasinocladus_malaysianus.AAC.2
MAFTCPLGMSGEVVTCLKWLKSWGAIWLVLSLVLPIPAFFMARLCAVFVYACHTDILHLNSQSQVVGYPLEA